MQADVMYLPKSLTELAEHQHGLLTTSQCLAELTPRQLDHRQSTGMLESVRVGVQRVAGSPHSYEQDLLAAVLACGPGALVSHRAVGALLGIDGFPRGVLEVTVPASRRVRQQGVRVHDTQVLGPRHCHAIDGIPTTSVARFLCDMTALHRIDRVARTLDEALRRDLVTLDGVLRVWLDLKTRGRRRSTITRELLDERLGGLLPGDSHPEVRLVRALGAAGLRRPVQQHPVTVGGCRYVLDLAYVDELVDIEYDGWAVHSTRTAFDRDRARDNALTLAGWLVLRFTSKSTVAEIVATVSEALASRGHSTTHHVG